MARTLKTNLTLGLGFLFVVILLLSGVGAYFLLRLSRSAEATLQDNYRSVAYARRMTDALADLRDARPTTAGAPLSAAYAQAQQRFTQSLRDEQRNITEPGEQQLVDSLTAGYQAFVRAPATVDAGRYQQLCGQITRVATLNLRAIEQQSQRTRRIVSRTVGTLGVLAAVGILATFSFIFSFPDYVTKPVEQLTAGIRRVAAGDYGQRLPVRAGDEFAPAAEALNELADRLDRYETAAGTPRIDDSGPLEVVTAPQPPPDPAEAFYLAQQRQLIARMLREQAQELQRTADAVEPYIPPGRRPADT